MSESFAEMFEESLKDTVMTIGEVIKAEVVSVDGDYVTVTARKLKFHSLNSLKLKANIMFKKAIL